MSKVTTILGTLAVMMLVCGSALGAIGDVYSDDFEDETLGTPPEPTSTPTPYWIDSLVGGSYTTPVVEWAPTYTGSGSQAYYDPGYQGSSISGARKYWRYTTQVDTPVEFTFTFDVYIRDVNVDNRLRLLFMDSLGTGYGPGVALNLDEVRIWDAEGTVTLVGTAPESTWMNIAMYVNTATRYVSVSLDGDPAVSTTYNTTSETTPPLDQLWIKRDGGNPAFFLLDNLELTVIPEPVTLAFLAVGGLLALLKRKSR